MNPNPVRVDQAFGLLKARSCGRAPTNLDLEELTMQESMKAKSTKNPVLVKAVLAVLVCVAIGGGVVVAGGVQQISEYFGFASVSFTLPDGENVTVDGVLDGNKLLNEDGEVILTFEPVDVNSLPNEGKFVTEDGEVMEGYNGTFEIAK